MLKGDKMLRSMKHSGGTLDKSNNNTEIEVADTITAIPSGTTNGLDSFADVNRKLSCRKHSIA